jgi:glutamate racemase
MKIRFIWVIRRESPAGPNRLRLYVGIRNAGCLLEKDVKRVVVACNTSTAIELTGLRDRLSIPIIGVIDPGVRKGIKSTRNKKIGVIGTEPPSKAVLIHVR